VFLPDEVKHKQEMFDGYWNEYRKAFHPFSFSNDWKYSDAEKKCYATQAIFK